MRENTKVCVRCSYMHDTQPYVYSEPMVLEEGNRCMMHVEAHARCRVGAVSAEEVAI